MQAERDREVWITGTGIVSCLGEGPQAHWERLTQAHPAAETAAFAPYVVHPLAPLALEKQIPKKGDQRQMEPWQRIGTYAAGLALESAGLKGHPELLGRTDMIVAAGGGERDLSVDQTILTGLRSTKAPAEYLNERLMQDLRPTLFLAQLSNLLAGNISIVHGVTGSSRTFMGEESSGVDAVRVAMSRVAAGQSMVALVGGSQNAERNDMLLLYALGSFLLKDGYRPVWERSAQPGVAPGSLGAFVVIEAREHAVARGAAPIARLSALRSARADRRQPGAITQSLAQMWEQLESLYDANHLAVISGATGVEPATGEERAFLAQHPEVAVRATGSHLGHGLEPQFVMNVAIAALAVGRGMLFPPCDGSGIEQPMEGPLTQAVVTSVGHWRGEGLALVEAVH
jgi:3-oxoacyl-[acyl-carrier-protein] synthase II